MSLPSSFDRLEKKLAYERRAWQQGYRSVAGVDEVGRGALAGPVVAAACLIDPGALEGSAASSFLDIEDSKQLTAKKRKELFDMLTRSPHVDYGIGIVDASVIDKINILQATFQAMRQAIVALKRSVDLVLVDGRGFFYESLPVWNIVRGDALSCSIGAASILAKVTRDTLVAGFAHDYPEYGFEYHKGYGTAFHLEKINTWGPTPYHRLSFAPCKGDVS